MQWWEKEASLVEPRLRNRAGDRPVVFETGYGPSGLPHLGTFAEVARTCFVQRAFKAAHPEIVTRIIAFSDDMDGLRSVPENLPHQEEIAAHLGRPLSQMPDPFGEAESFSAHMIGKLKDFLQTYGFDCEFLSSSECYNSGRFDEGLLLLLNHEEQIRNIVLPTLQPETRQTWSPFLPICGECGRYTTRVTATIPEEGALEYTCDQVFGGAEPCGHSARTPITGGRVKVGWKIDWALRWIVLGVDYEMFGKDLIESADISRKICKAVGHRAPVGSFYELFLDEEGRKISKKIGNGIALGEWLSHAPDDSILQFLTKQPRKARRIGHVLVGRTTDEFLNLLRKSEDNEEMLKMLAECAPATPRTHRWAFKSDVDFSLLVSLVGALGVTDPESVLTFLKDNESLTIASDDEDFIRELIQFAMNYHREVIAVTAEPLDPSTLEAPELAALEALRARLEAIPFDDPAELQNLTYAIGKEHALELRPWFGVLYSVLTGNPTGPRLGTLLRMLGRQRAIERIAAIPRA
jgi:lysyl-tRNA synthetase class 1